MIDGNEADDKIIAVMKGDALYGAAKDITDIPEQIVERLFHYFITYKDMPGEEETRNSEITDTYNREEAFEVIQRSMEDYRDAFNESKQELFSMIQKGLK